MKKQSELVRALRAELAAKEKELADQKWVFEQFLKSPVWRWSAPLRWAVNRLRNLGNGHTPEPPAASEALEAVEGYKTLTPDDDQELKASYSVLCRVSLENFLATGVTLELPRAANPVISIVLVLFNRAELTLACLRSIAESYMAEIEVVIVDNASSDRTPGLLERLTGPRIIRNNENRHFLAAANQAAAECRGQYILFLNNDAQLMPGALQSALQTIQSSPDIGAVGGKILLLDGGLQEAGSIVWRDGSCSGYGRGDTPFAPMYNFRRDVDYCSGAFLLTPRKVWEELGGFDAIFAPAYYEETDYCMRLWQRGLRVVYEPDATILHYEFASSESAASATSLQAQHQAIFAMRHQAVLEKRATYSPDRVLHARSPGSERRILFLDDRVPHLWLGSGFPRAHALLRTLRDLGNFVTLYPLSVIRETWDQAYSDIPREVEIMLRMGPQMLESFLRSRKGYYSAIIVSRPHNMKYLAPILEAHPDWFEEVDVIYDAEAVFAEREIGRRKLMGNPMTDEEIQIELASEISLASLADRVLAVSENEKRIFQSHGIEHVSVLGHSIEVSPTPTPFESREGLLFVGAVHNEVSPNGDSLIWFLTEVFPKIRQKLGNVPFTMAGINLSERVRELAQAPAKITGHLPTLKDIYSKSRIFVAPTRYAAGIPHKIHEAAAFGLPVVANALLARQLGWSCQELAIAEDAETFAARCIEIYTDGTKWLKLRQAALERVRDECSPSSFEERTRRLLEVRK